MDPLSVSASVIGILGAAAKITSLLITFTKNTRSAPKIAQTVLSEVTGTTTVLSQLQHFLLGQTVASKSRASLILIEQVIVTLTECVTTFSELEKVLDSSKPGVEITSLDRVKWAMKEPKISAISVRLQSNKSSLTLMLTILQCQSMQEAESAMDRLCGLVEQVLTSNQDMSKRLRALDGEPTVPGKSAKGTRNGVDEQSIRSVASDERPRETRKEGIQRNALGFAFEEELMASRVYKRPLYSQSGESLVTSAARTTASSILSALSLSDMSNISILAVPVYAHEISNSQRYVFGEFNPDSIVVQNEPMQFAKSSPKTTRWDFFSNAVRKGRRSQKRIIDEAATKAHPEERILGVALSISIRFANVAISMTNEDGESFVYGYIPLFVAKTGVFLKEQGTEVENIFSISGSPKRLKDLEITFNSPPRFGKSLKWTGYTVHDAANILVRFLSQMPESVIPVDIYEKFQEPIRARKESFDPTPAIRSYQDLIVALPPLHRQLLLYLLDTLAVFASKSDINKMTTPRLAAIFAPLILSPVRSGEENIEDPFYRRLSQEVLIFLIENQDSFLIGMNGASLEPEDNAVNTAVATTNTADDNKTADETRSDLENRNNLEDSIVESKSLFSAIPERPTVRRNRSF